MSNFTKISSKYESDSIVQRSASEILLELLDIQDNDNILDLGCGTGHIAQLIKEKTNGTVVGVDPAKGMIEEATKKYSDYGISFRNLSVEQLDYQNEFDAIFCNSVFQWFPNPGIALEKCHKALNFNGKIAIQAPAKKNYCPNFIEAINAVERDPLTRDTFSRFTSPWFFLETADDYQKLFEDTGFSVSKSNLERVATYHSLEEVFNIFESGAAAGYLNQQFYKKKLPESYPDRFRKIINNTFSDQVGQTGTIELVFYRIYLLAAKEA